MYSSIFLLLMLKTSSVPAHDDFYPLALGVDERSKKIKRLVSILQYNQLQQCKSGIIRDYSYQTDKNLV